MLKFNRIGLVVALVATMVLADSNFAVAQGGGIKFGGGSNNNNNNNNKNNQNNNRRNRNRDDDDKKSDAQQFQQFFQGGQGGQGSQNNSGNSQQFRKSNNQQGGQNGQQFQQFFQNGQGGQGNNWQTQKFSRHNELQKWVVGFNGGPQPFSDDWYNNHPQAWQIKNKNKNKNNQAWQIATAAGVFGWLGWQANHPYNNTVYVYDPVPVQTVIVGGQPSVVFDPTQGEWMTLGAYSLMTGAGDPGRGSCNCRWTSKATSAAAITT